MHIIILYIQLLLRDMITFFGSKTLYFLSDKITFSYNLYKF